ncbi:peptidoglycan-binding domain-containing protein [Marivita sp. GX14005]|uniref:peptidoglycan-binding domain-containing protein n=1 Tax=Marivita sp. GX14005 TaxID=2942276 RepID=UPI002019FC37|nr:peptidoglycan-binding domain-containing protein [Marivita sp. GX14005]MCL3882555.1 peptidoglycan-binding protein [Marivita sp. GX14005]
MKRHSIAALVAASMVASVPGSASADAKDALIGGIVGAIIQKGISDSQRAKPQRKVYQKSSKSKKRTYTAPSLNSQYSRSERIQIQSAFRDLGYGIGTVDGVLGQNSRRVIRQFQASRGEAQTGQLTRAQYVALLSQTPGATPVFAQRPLSGDEVRMLQQGLQMLGYYRGRIDGAKGPGTRGALNAFLAQQGLNPVQVTPVQGLVRARTAAGLQTPRYLQQEAGNQMAGAQPFGQQPQQAFGQPHMQQPGFAAPGQPQANPFGTPAQNVPQGYGVPGQAMPGQGGQYVSAPGQVAPGQQQMFGVAQPQPQMQRPGAAQPVATSLFGAPQPQPQPQVPGAAAPVANPQQNLFAPAAPQQQLAPQPAAPQNGQGGTALFASGGAVAPQAVAPAQQASQSSLDIFTGSAQGTTIAQPNEVAGQSQ